MGRVRGCNWRILPPVLLVVQQEMQLLSTNGYQSVQILLSGSGLLYALFHLMDLVYLLRVRCPKGKGMGRRW